MRALAWIVGLALALALAACGGGDGEVVTLHGSAVEHGRSLFADPRASTSPSNAFSCATCHPGEGTEGRIPSGADLAGVTTRRSFWGGQRVDLLDAINDCRLSFMDAPAPWKASDEDAKAMWAYLASRPGASAPAPFTVVFEAPDLPPGDPGRGKVAYDLACRGCHGALHDGEGRLAVFVPRLPDDVNAAHATFAPADRRRVFRQKIRTGAFGSGAGSMPPFSREVLSDGDVAALLAYLGQY